MENRPLTGSDKSRQNRGIILVTGASGFIGSHLVESLLADGVPVRCLVQKDTPLAWIKGLDVEVIWADLTDFDSLLPAVSGIDGVIHLAGITKSMSEDEFHRVNVLGTVNLIKAVAQWAPAIRRFLFVSSQAAAGPSRGSKAVTEYDPPRPLTYYGMSKLSAEEAVMAFRSRLPVTVVRPVPVYGPRDLDVLTAFRLIRKGIRPVIGWRQRHVGLIFVDDLVQGLKKALESENAVGQTYFLVSDSRVSWNDFGKAIARVAGKKTLKLHVPVSLMYFVTLVSEMVARRKGCFTVVNRQKWIEMKQRSWICDGSRARQELGFKPAYSLDQAIRKTMDWYLENGWLEP